VKVALYQFRPEFGQIRENLKSVINAVKNKNFDLLVLPELFASGYLFESREEAVSLADEAGQGETYEEMSKLARDKKAMIVFGFPQKENGKLYNSSAAIYPDGEYEIYQKIHLFDSEKEIFDTGETGFSVFEFNGANLGMMICFDWRFPEAARTLALMGTDIICHPANLVLPHCPDAIITRALENNVFTITCDRIGDEERAGRKLHFIGKSRIVSPKGIIVQGLGETETGYIEADIEPSEARKKSINARNNIFEDRHPEYYRQITEN